MPTAAARSENWLSIMFEIRRNGIALCSSSIPCGGYHTDTLRDMVKHGYSLYLDGKRYHLPKTQPHDHKKEPPCKN